MCGEIIDQYYVIGLCGVDSANNYSAEVCAIVDPRVVFAAVC